MQIEAPSNISTVKLEITHYAWLNFILGSPCKKWSALESFVDNKEYTNVYKNLKQIANK